MTGGDATMILLCQPPEELSSQHPEVYLRSRLRLRGSDGFLFTSLHEQWSPIGNGPPVLCVFHGLKEMMPLHGRVAGAQKCDIFPPMDEPNMRHGMNEIPRIPDNPTGDGMTPELF